MFQSTRPQGARQAPVLPLPKIRKVSIHAPARGATHRNIRCCGIVKFQSTRPQGARHGPIWRMAFDGCFNPRARKGRDAKGFNFWGHKWFQSTRPQGARPRPGSPIITPYCFNPRARKGRDGHWQKLALRLSVSIHAPARGATTVAAVMVAKGSFQSTRPQGARPLPLIMIHYPECFNPRARKGRDTQMTPATWVLRCFNPRARKGRDVFASYEYGWLPVSIHAPARGATG